jgi:ubiquinone/menaquinone biosynthesis C-methylase UbiE
MKPVTIGIPQPKELLPFTGERYTSALWGQLHHEHFHRYLFILEFCRGADVLDMACGEGYGASLLGHFAKTVEGVDIDQPTIDHALRSYKTETVSFRLGNATCIPVADHSKDVVVSFETLEHLRDHEAFLAEVKRVLKVDGLLAISTPEIDAYNEAGGKQNPFHLRELTQKQFQHLLKSQFAHVQLYSQRPLCGSCIAPVERAPVKELRFYDRVAPDAYNAIESFPTPIYFIALASNRELPEIRYSLLHDKFHAYDLAQKQNPAGRPSQARAGLFKLLLSGLSALTRKE